LILIEPEVDMDDDKSGEVTELPFQSLSLPEWAYAHMQFPQPRPITVEPEVDIDDTNDTFARLCELPFRSLDLPEWAHVHVQKAQPSLMLTESEVGMHDKVYATHASKEPFFQSLELPDWERALEADGAGVPDDSFDSCEAVSDDDARSVAFEVSTAASTPPQCCKNPMSDGEIYASFIGAVVLQTCILAIAVL